MAQRENAEKAENVQRIARLCFFVFVVLQAPCLLIDSPRAPNGIAMVSPLQLSMGALVTRLPEAVEFCHLMLFPGTWVRRAARCARLLRSPGAAAPAASCQAAAGRLTPPASPRPPRPLPRADQGVAGAVRDVPVADARPVRRRRAA
jgi:hypothetical protein